MKLAVYLSCLVANVLKYGIEGRTDSQDGLESNGVRDSSTLQVHSFNPSFRKPMFMQYMAAKRHAPGRDVILPCMAVGVKPIAYYWYFNGNLVTKKQRVKFTSERSMLRIKRIRDADVGIYTCTASNSYGNLSYNFDIKIQEKEKLPAFYDREVMVRQQLVVLPAQASARLPCHAESRAPVHYLWIKDGIPYLHIKPKSARSKPSDITVVDNEVAGDLLIKSLKVRDAGKYTCVAFNRYGNASFTYELRIVLRRSGGPPKVLPFTRPTEQHVYTNSSLNLDCLETMSGTLPDVRWFHFYKEPDRNDMPTITGNIDWEHFIPESLPFRTDYVSAHSYQTFRVRQDTHSRLSPYVHDDTDPYGIRLELRNVTRDDAGVYVCLVSNSDGYDFATFYLQVTEGHSNRVSR